MATPGSDPFSGTNSRNILQHMISPKLVANGTAGYDAKVDLINVDNIYYTGDVVRVDDTGESLGKWVEDIPSISTSVVTATGSIQAGVDIQTLPMSTRYFVTLNPINDSTYTTLKYKSLSTIIHYTPTGDIVGGGTIFIDINNYITISSHPVIANMVLITVISNSSLQEMWSVSFRRIFS